MPTNNNNVICAYTISSKTTQLHHVPFTLEQIWNFLISPSSPSLLFTLYSMFLFSRLWGEVHWLTTAGNLLVHVEVTHLQNCRNWAQVVGDRIWIWSRAVHESCPGNQFLKLYFWLISVAAENNVITLWATPFTYNLPFQLLFIYKYCSFKMNGFCFSAIVYLFM